MRQQLRDRWRSWQWMGIDAAVAVSCSLAIVLITGCDEPSPTEHVETRPEALSQQSQTGTPPSLDTWFASVAEQVPGFGGAFYGDDGALNVYLQDTLQVAAARAALSSLLERTSKVGVDGRAPSGEMKVLKGTFDYRDLNEWRDWLRPEVLGIAGVVSLDIDETRNRIVVGTVDGTGGATAQMLEKLGIAPEAVITEMDQPVIPTSTLRSRVRPVRGGLLIAFSSDSCTQGFNAYYNGIRSYVTCSHCTDTRSVVDSTEHYQPSVGSGNFIGTEYKDPAWITGGQCPPNHVCRWSDAAMGEYDGSVTSIVGKIARTTQRTQTGGSLTIDPANPFFYIDSVQPVAYYNDVVDKIGSNSGWTYGQVKETCVDIDLHPANIVMLCQYAAYYTGVGGGDSGSPVFYYSEDEFATLVGILWGSPIEDNTRFFFSVMGMVAWELGTLEVTYDMVEVEIEGPHTIKKAGYYTWTADAVGGDGEYTYLWEYRPYGGSWQTIGTSSSVQRYVSGDDYPYFRLRVTAYSGGLQDTDEIQVNVVIPPS